MTLENHLNNLVGKGYLKKEKIGIDQVKLLLKSSYRNLRAAKKNLEISEEEVAYATAYTAMLQLARAIIYLHGYRPDDGQQHKTTIEAAGKILGQNFNDLIYRFDKMRKKRNQFIYEPALPLNREETISALKTAIAFYHQVKQYLEKAEPQLKLF